MAAMLTFGASEDARADGAWLEELLSPVWSCTANHRLGDAMERTGQGDLLVAFRQRGKPRLSLLIHEPHQTFVLGAASSASGSQLGFAAQSANDSR